MLLEHTKRADEVRDLAAPAAADLQVFPIDVPMRVERARTHVRVVAGNVFLEHGIPMTITELSETI